MAATFIDRLLDHYLWLMGLLLMVEPMLDYSIERYHAWADRYISRKLRARIAITISIFAVFVACFLSFRDQYYLANGERLARIETEKELNEARRELAMRGIVQPRHLSSEQKRKLRENLSIIAKDIPTISVFTEGLPEQVHYAFDFINIFNELGIYVPLVPFVGYSKTDSDKGVMVGLTDINRPSDLAKKFIDALQGAELDIKRIEWNGNPQHTGIDFDLFIGAAL